MASKRARASSPSPTTPLPSPPPSPPSKAQRTLPSTSTSGPEHRPLLCTLPPTCHPPHNHPTPLADTHALEAHYATYHAHVCEERGCGCVFPDARLLELHQTECHDPLAAVRKDRGERIFACHVQTCPRRFLTPKARRLHLISAHGYPKAYFFAVTNKGVGGLLKRWGEGASLVRGTWQPRDSTGGDNQAGEDTGESDNDDPPRMRDVETDRMQDAGGAPATSADAQSVVAPPSPDTARTQSRPKAASSNPVDTLTSSLDALSLVPSTIRFGRGARRGAHGHGHGHAPGRGRGRGRGLGDERGGGAPGRPVDGPAAGEERTERRALGDGVLKRGRGLGGARARARAM